MIQSASTGRLGWRLSGRTAAAAQLALVVAPASLLDEWSTDNDRSHPHEHNRDKEREGHACAPAPGDRHRDPRREHRGDDHSTPPHDPWKSVLRRCASPVENARSVGAQRYRRDPTCGSSMRDSHPRLWATSRFAGSTTHRTRTHPRPSGESTLAQATPSWADRQPLMACPSSSRIVQALSTRLTVSKPSL
jgi:hypothetical protein